MRQRQLVRGWLKDKYDVSMANGGPQVMEMIRSLPQGKDLPVVFLTGKNDEASIRSVMALHPAGYLLKSVSEADLLKKVADVLGEA